MFRVIKWKKSTPTSLAGEAPLRGRWEGAWLSPEKASLHPLLPAPLRAQGGGLRRPSLRTSLKTREPSALLVPFRGRGTGLGAQSQHLLHQEDRQGTGPPLRGSRRSWQDRPTLIKAWRKTGATAGLTLAVTTKPPGASVAKEALSSAPRETFHLRSPLPFSDLLPSPAESADELPS